MHCRNNSREEHWPEKIPRQLTVWEIGYRPGRHHDRKRNVKKKASDFVTQSDVCCFWFLSHTSADYICIFVVFAFLTPQRVCFPYFHRHAETLWWSKELCGGFFSPLFLLQTPVHLGGWEESHYTQTLIQWWSRVQFCCDVFTGLLFSAYFSVYSLLPCSAFTLGSSSSSLWWTDCLITSVYHCWSEEKFRRWAPASLCIILAVVQHFCRIHSTSVVS